MTPTVSQVQDAYREGYEAGYSRTPAMPNPYAAEPLRPWELARMNADERATVERAQRDQRLIAITWLGGWRKGLDAYAAERRAARSKDHHS